MFIYNIKYKMNKRTTLLIQILFLLQIIFQLNSQSSTSATSTSTNTTTQNIFNCKKNPLGICPTNSNCNAVGLCVCNQFYYGESCEININTLKNLEITKNGISIDLYYGVISGLIVGFLLILIIGILIIYFKLKDIDY